MAVQERMGRSRKGVHFCDSKRKRSVWVVLAAPERILVLGSESDRNDV